MSFTVGSFAPGWSWGAVRVLSAAAVIGAGAAWTAYGAASESLGPPSDPELRMTSLALSVENEAFTASLGLVDHRTVEVARGETLGQVVRRAGGTTDEARAISGELAKFVDPQRVDAGLPITVYFERSGATPRLTGLSFRSQPGAVVSVSLAYDGAYRARQILTPLTFEIARVAGKVDTSLYDAAIEGGATEREIQAIADVFAYDVDFQRDIFQGDAFEIVFERFRDDAGATVRTGEALFVSLQTREGVKSFYRFKGPNGDYDWYDPNGRTARKFLMKTPINGARLSSGFGMRRHPVLGFSRMHRGVDFAAPTGTPVMAAGDGKLEKVGWGGGLGRSIQVQHSDGYETIYGHLSAFARGLKPGQAVRQGQLIGYVGSTGLSTGPHLHYEVVYRGAHINPMSMRVPTGRNLDGEWLKVFQVERTRIDALRTEREASLRGGSAAAVSSQLASAATAQPGDGLRGAIQ